jgi:hypothetical protein
VLAYAIFVWHYAVNAPFADDWSRAPIVSDALHHNIRINSAGQLWDQYSEARLLVSNLLVIVFGFVNRLNLRTVVLFSALVFAATYFLMLVALRRYLRRPLAFGPIFSLGVVWFSFVGVSNALWAFQLAWYLVLFFLFAAIFFLCIRPRNRPLALTLAIVAAVLGSFSMVQGFLIWPTGLVALLWVWTRERKRWGEVGAWSACAAVTMLVYLHGYHWGVGCIGPAQNCSIVHNAGRPVHTSSYYLTLAGDALGIAVRWPSAVEQLLGVLVLAAAAVVIVRSVQTRDRTRLPLPLLMIVFALLFDLTVALGRAGQRLVAGQQGRYTMPNLILVAALVAYAWAHPPRLRAARSGDRRAIAITAACAALGLFVVAQGVYGTQYGIRQARVLRSHQVRDARTVINLDRVPYRLRGCYINLYVWNGAFDASKALVLIGLPLYSARHDRLMMFDPKVYRRYRAQGPPPPPACKSAHTPKPRRKTRAATG